MVIKEVKNADGALQILEMAKEHPAPEYDCSFAAFCRIFSKLYFQPEFRSWVAYQGDEPVGYVCGIRSQGLRNQIDVFDIYLKSEVRGRKNILLFTDKLKEWAVQDGALRVVWTSKVNRETWKRILGLPVSECSIFVWEVEHG